MNVFTCCCRCRTTCHAGASLESAGSELILLLSQALTFLGCSVLPWALLGCLLCTVAREKWGRWAAWFPGPAPATGFSPLWGHRTLGSALLPLVCRCYVLQFILIINWTFYYYYYFKIFFVVLIQEKRNSDDLPFDSVICL